MIFKQLEPNSVSVTPFIVHKYWEINSSDSSSGVLSYAGQFYGSNPRSLQVQNLATTTDNFLKPLVYQNIQSMFAGNFIDTPLEKIGETDNYQQRILYENVNVISVPQKLFGESVKKKKLEFDIDLPNSVQLLYNSEFQTSESISNVPDPYLITTSSLWYCGMGDAVIINNQQLNISNTLSQPSELYQVIPSSSISGGSYLLNINIANITVSNINLISIRIYQPAIQNTTFTLPITGFNNDLSATIQLDPNANALIIIRYPNPVLNTITYNQISINELETRHVIDDGHGNLIDTLYSQSSAETKDAITPNIVGEWNFRNGYQCKNKYQTEYPTRDDSRFKNNGTLNNVMYTDGNYSTKATFDYIGPKTIETIYALMKDGVGNIIEIPINIQMELPDNNIRIPYNKYENLYNFKRTEDFCISGIIELKSDITSSTIPDYYLQLTGLGSIKIVWIGDAGNQISIINGTSVNTYTLNGMIQDYEYIVPLNPPYNIYIKGNIDFIKSIELLNPTKVSKRTKINLEYATQLQNINISYNLGTGCDITLPHNNSIEILNARAINTIIPFISGNFNPDTNLYIDLSYNNYDSTTINNILTYFNTYYTGSMNTGSILDLSSNPGCYDATGLLLSSSLSSSEWIIIP